MKIRFISRLLAILIFLPLFLFYYISPAFSQSGCQKIYDKKLTRLKHQLSSERRQIEKDFVRNKEALKKRREELKAKFRALDNIFDPASSLRFQCDAFKDKIDKYNFEMDFARRTLDTASEEYDKKTAPLKEGLKKTLKQWKDCLAKLEAKRKESASFRQRLEEKNRALNKLTDTTAQISDLEQENKKTLKRKRMAANAKKLLQEKWRMACGDSVLSFQILRRQS